VKLDWTRQKVCRWIEVVDMAGDVLPRPVCADDVAGSCTIRYLNGEGGHYGSLRPGPRILCHNIQGRVRFRFREGSPEAKRRGVERWLELQRARDLAAAGGA
jgi:hypothetical protein